MSIIDKIIMWIFIMAGQYFFDEVEVQSDDQEENVLSMTFRKSEREERKK